MLCYPVRIVWIHVFPFSEDYLTHYMSLLLLNMCPWLKVCYRITISNYLSATVIANAETLTALSSEGNNFSMPGKLLLNDSFETVRKMHNIGCEARVCDTTVNYVAGTFTNVESKCNINPVWNEWTWVVFMLWLEAGSVNQKLFLGLKTNLCKI